MAPDPCVLPNRDGERPGEKGNKSPDTIAFLDEIQTCRENYARLTHQSSSSLPVCKRKLS